MSDHTVKDVGEFGLIDRLVAALPPGARADGGDVVVGAGDDAAILRVPAGKVQVVTTDAMVEGIHFRLDWTDWASLGHKALASNLSDIAAMGGRPAVAVVTLGLRGDESVGDLEDLYRGMGELARRHGTVIVGGDIVRVTGERLISITAMGLAEEGSALLRSGAQPGDAIGVTGTIGASAAGMEILRQPGPFADRATADLLVQAHLRPEPRVAAGQLLVAHGATAAMDLSDGLAGDLPKILAASGVSGEIDAGRLPVIAAVRGLFPDRWLELGLRGGEDYELLFTIPPGRWEALALEAEARGITLTRIGTVRPVDGRPLLTLIHPGGNDEPFPAGAFDHFG